MGDRELGIGDWGLGMGTLRLWLRHAGYRSVQVWGMVNYGEILDKR